jgi:hypothetical protein
MCTSEVSCAFRIKNKIGLSMGLNKEHLKYNRSVHARKNVEHYSYEVLGISTPKVKLQECVFLKNVKIGNTVFHHPYIFCPHEEFFQGKFKRL